MISISSGRSSQSQVSRKRYWVFSAAMSISLMRTNTKASRFWDCVPQPTLSPKQRKSWSYLHHLITGSSAFKIMSLLRVFTKCQFRIFTTKNTKDHKGMQRKIYAPIAADVEKVGKTVL